MLGALWLRDSAAGRTLTGHAVERLRDQAAIGTLPSLLFYIARGDATTDRWAAAEAGYDETVRLARETGQSTDLALALAGRAWLQARRGRPADSRADAEESIRISRKHDVHVAHAWSMFALGELELAGGRMVESLEEFQRLSAILDDLGILDVDLMPGPELAEVLQRLGRGEQARAVAARYAQAARDKGQPWALARAGRTSGLLAADDGFEEHFEAALRLHEQAPDAFELARTQLALGGRLRRARRRVDARPPLRAGLSSFERLGATPWADLAALELRATGETAVRRAVGGVSELTGQELQIARMLAEGRTTRQAAAALFLSPKTVEYHLRHVYTKLDIRSREELARAVPPD